MYHGDEYTRIGGKHILSILLFLLENGVSKRMDIYENITRNPRSQTSSIAWRSSAWSFRGACTAAAESM